MEVYIWIIAVVFGIIFSNQRRSRSEEAVFWLVYILIRGHRRWVVIGKNPNKLENRRG